MRRDAPSSLQVHTHRYLFGGARQDHSANWVYPRKRQDALPQTQSAVFNIHHRLTVLRLTHFLTNILPTHDRNRSASLFCVLFLSFRMRAFLCRHDDATSLDVREHTGISSIMIGATYQLRPIVGGLEGLEDMRMSGRRII